MVEKQGIIAGIGDKINGVNLIPPKMDADIYNYIIGREKCVIEGLTLNSTSFTAGTCVCRGYRGILDRDLALTGNEGLTETNYIYGKFVINGVNDSFSVVGSNVALTSGTLGNDYVTIRNGASGATDRYPYIAKAENAEYAKVVTDNAMSHVTAVTQNVNDNSTKVATTAYVKNQIDADINFGTTDVTIKDKDGRTIGQIHLVRKAKLVSGVIDITNYANGSGTITFEIPAGYYPKQTETFALIVPNLAQQNISLLGMQIATNGAVLIRKIISTTDKWTNDFTYQLIGWEIP